MVKIVGIGGSLRAGSYSQLALKVAAARAEALGAEVEILDLRSLHLPFCDGENDYPITRMWKNCGMRYAKPTA